MTRNKRTLLIGNRHELKQQDAVLRALASSSMIAPLPSTLAHAVRYHQEREEQQVRERLNAELMKHLDEASLKQKDLDNAAARERVLEKLRRPLTPQEEALAERIVAAAQTPAADASAAQERLLREMSQSVLGAALNSLPSAGLHSEADKQRGALIISNAEIVKLAKLPRVVRVENFKKWHRDDKCQREGCGKLVGNHSLKKFVAHHHVELFNEPLEAHAAVLTFEFPERFDAAEVDAAKGVWLHEHRIATKYVDGRIASFRLTFGFRIGIYERTDEDEFIFMCEKVNEDAEAADSRIF